MKRFNMVLALVATFALTGCMNLLTPVEELVCGSTADRDRDGFFGDEIPVRDADGNIEGWVPFPFGGFTWKQCQEDPQYANNPEVGAFSPGDERDCNDERFDLDNDCRGSYGDDDDATDDDDDDASDDDDATDDDDDDASDDDGPNPLDDRLVITWDVGSAAPEIWLSGRIYEHGTLDTWRYWRIREDARTVTATLDNVDRDMWIRFNGSADMNGDGDAEDPGVDHWSCTTDEDDRVGGSGLMVEYEGEQLDDLDEDFAVDNGEDGCDWYFRVQDLD